MDNSITFHEEKYTLKELKRLTAAGFHKKYQQEALNFLDSWWNEESHIQAQTSGSTGTPKVIRILKKDMTNSALATGRFFNFQEGDKHFNPLPAKFIAGKMMLVRSLKWETDLHFIAPTANPLKFCTEKFHFAVMTPHQLMEGLQSEYRSNINNIETLLLGGSPINTTLENLISELSTAIYLGYGMTETMSHIALRKVNGADMEKNYQAVDGVTFSQDDRECLVIHTAHLSIKTVITNDVVELIDEHTFLWKGRFDNVINSGGIKLHPEQIEKKIASLISSEYYVTHEEDDKLGQRLVLKIEGKNDSEIDEKLRDSLEKYEMPKKVYFVDNFQRTETGKIIRK